MKKIIKYQCEICKTVYEKRKDALMCENRGINPPIFEIGSLVFIAHRYPRDPNRPFGQRTITKILTENRHRAEYVFNKVIQIGKDAFIGDDPGWGTTDIYYPAEENDIFKIGDNVPGYLCPKNNGPTGCKLYLEMVDESI